MGEVLFRALELHNARKDKPLLIKAMAGDPGDRRPLWINVLRDNLDMPKYQSAIYSDPIQPFHIVQNP